MSTFFGVVSTFNLPLQSGSCLGIEERKVAEREGKEGISGYFGKK